MGILDIVFWVQERMEDAKDKVVDVADNVRDVGEEIVDTVKPYAEVATGLITGKLIADAAEEQTQNDIDRLNKINKENSKIVETINKQSEKTKKEYENAMSKLVMQKKHVYTNILEPYHELMKKLIADSRFNATKEDVINLDIDLDVVSNVDYERKDYNGHTMLHVFTGTSAIAVARGVLTSVKIEFEIDKAKEEQARLKAEREKIYAKCKVIEKTTEFLNLSYIVVTNLEETAKYQIAEIEMIINRKGCDCKDFSSQDILLLKNCTNLVVLLNNIVNVHIVNEKGILNPIYTKYIQEQLNKEN